MTHDDHDTGLGTLSRDVAVLTARYETTNGKITALDAKFDALVSELGRSRQTPWGMLISALSVGLLMVSGGWYLISLQSQLTVANAVNPLLGQSAASVQDRVDLRAAVTANRDALGKVTADLAALASGVKQQLVEVEAQFKAAGQIENLRGVNAQREFYRLWHFLGQDYPETFYAPGIAREPGG